VVRVVGAGNRPVPVEDEVISACRARLDETGCVELDERACDVAIG
jgi:hypothetical protein